MRYRDTGEVHKDFHLATNSTIEYIMEHYGQDFLFELCRRTAQRVYADIYRNIGEGNVDALTEHLEYYFGREGGEYEITQDGDDVTVKVSRCPMISHILDRGNTLSPHMGEFLSRLYGSFGDNTPYTITVDYIYPERAYTIKVRRSSNAAQ